MMNTHSAVAFAVAAVSCSGVAQATITPAGPITLAEDSAVSVQFVSQSAGARGSLYFLGTESSDGQMSFVTSSDTNNLGMVLFENHTATPNSTIELGEYDAGASLHFAYLVTRGVPVAPTGSLFRTDDEVGAFNFAIGNTALIGGANVTRVGIEDIQDQALSDFDYNDIIFDVSTTAIPAPGSIALVLAGGLVMTRRRKA